MKYYSVLCPSGHVGSGKSKELLFYIRANDAYCAMKQAMRMPAIKHSRIAINVKEVTEQEYMINLTRNAYHKNFSNS